MLLSCLRGVYNISGMSLRNVIKLPQRSLLHFWNEFHKHLYLNDNKQKNLFYHLTFLARTNLLLDTLSLVSHMLILWLY